MLDVRVTAPHAIVEGVSARLVDDPTVSNLAQVRGVTPDGAGDVLLFEVARENADAVVQMLRDSGVPETGSIVVSETLTVVSAAADAAERAAPGHPADGVLWAQLADRSREDARWSSNFFLFLLLATLIAGIGRILDQPILIIGAMVVGPEFAAVAALCYGVVRRQGRIAAGAAATLVGGFAACAVIAWVVWAIVYRLGWITYEQATSGPLTDFIIAPDAWSFVIAVIAGVAGVLSLTSSKSAALVGVFISITTVPAVGTIGLTAAVGAWQETASALLQLGINVAGLLVAGVVTLLVQVHVTPRRPVGAARATRPIVPAP